MQNIPDTVTRTDNAVDSFDAPSDLDEDMDDSQGNEVRVNPKTEDRASSFFAQPGVLAGRVFFNIIHFFKSSKHKNVDFNGSGSLTTVFGPRIRKSFDFVEIKTMEVLNHFALIK